MKHPIGISMLVTLSLTLTASIAFAQEKAAEAEAVYIIFDASGSMQEPLPDKTRKIDAAREVLKQFVKQDFAGKSLALRAYGHNRENDCSDTELVVPFSDGDSARSQITSFAENVSARGRTPISRSLRAALADFGERTGEIILISDGIETCDEDPCLLVRAWRIKDIKIRIHVVGLGLNEKEKAAMDCIAKAAGTEYLDAQTTDELATRMGEIHARVGPPSLKIRAQNSDGETMRVIGRATAESGEQNKVSSNSRHALTPGNYSVEVGVETRNGNPYRPVTKSVEVAEHGETVLNVVVVEPPSVHARFIEEGKEIRGSQVSAFQGGKEVLSFRWMDRTYVDPGSYEFRAKPNDENELSVAESFADGEHKEIVFNLAHTVQATIRMVATGSAIDFRENYELWQNGKKVKGVHWGNGVRAVPGVYDLHLTNPMTPYVHTGLKLTEEDKQSFRIEVPCGHVTIVYQDKDGNRDSDERCWVERKDGSKWHRNKTQEAGKKIPLVPGSYQVKGWDRKGKSYDPVPFSIALGDDKEIVLRSKE